MRQLTLAIPHLSSNTTVKMTTRWVQVRAPPQAPSNHQWVLVWRLRAEPSPPLHPSGLRSIRELLNNPPLCTHSAPHTHTPDASFPPYSHRSSIHIPTHTLHPPPMSPPPKFFF
ncbi:hypothetical protein CRE_21489 [Caenorhabditis remanei]|uniref:Uncharacterized protein n=1 Tax=Caenorhabditis remanei TaxID=31234 RepID=E3N8Z9_CAERE|nr:hypothetical protein CRE_21489 [Caenorhabditis remanei]